jgi:hypothetical protein
MKYNINLSNRLTPVAQTKPSPRWTRLARKT